jgi:UDP-N-acetylmuramoyl-tripeptide--D-alanyl-D-alanine ligase
VVLNVDDKHLAALADELAGRIGEPGGPGRLLRCSALDADADVCIVRNGGQVALRVAGEKVAEGVPVPTGLQASNLACAAGAALALGVPSSVIAGRLDEVTAVANRLVQAPAASGVVVIDDTFNANPSGARAALSALAAAPGHGRRAVVTPGMVELGARQAADNRAFAADAALLATDLVVVGRTNRRALLAGAGGLRTHWVRHREEAVEWVRTQLGPGDVVLYENDLPDHYP